MGQDLADGVAAGAERGKESVADGAFQGAACEAPVSFHVADFSLNDASAAEVGDQLRCQAAPCAADQHAGPGLGMAAIAAVDDGQIGALVGQDFHLFQGFPQGVAIVGVARKAAHADHEALIQQVSVLTLQPNS